MPVGSYESTCAVCLSGCTVDGHGGFGGEELPAFSGGEMSNVRMLQVAVYDMK